MNHAMNHLAMMGSQEQTMMNSRYTTQRLSSLAARSVLLISKRQYTSCKRRALIIEDEFKNTYLLLIIVNRVIFNRLVTI